MSGTKMRDVAFALKGHKINIIRAGGKVRVRIDGALAEPAFPDYSTAVAWMIAFFSNSVDA